MANEDHDEPTQWTVNAAHDIRVAAWRIADLFLGADDGTIDRQNTECEIQEVIKASFSALDADYGRLLENALTRKGSRALQDSEPLATSEASRGASRGTAGREFLAKRGIAPCRTRTCDLLVRSGKKGDGTGQQDTAAPMFSGFCYRPGPPENTSFRHGLSADCQSVGPDSFGGPDLSQMEPTDQLDAASRRLPESRVRRRTIVGTVGSRQSIPPPAQNVETRKSARPISRPSQLTYRQPERTRAQLGAD